MAGFSRAGKSGVSGQELIRPAKHQTPGTRHLLLKKILKPVIDQMIVQ